MAQTNYRLIDVDLYDPEAAQNFEISTLLPSSLPAPTSSSEAASIGQQIRQLLRAGDAEGALRGALETAPSGGDDRAKEVHTTTVMEVLQGIRQSDVSRVLGSVVDGDGGNARADTLMKYIYKGMATGSAGSGGLSSPTSATTNGARKASGVQPQGTGFSQMPGRNLGEGGSGQAMSVLLSWHEKLVDIVGVGGIIRVMSDRRTV